MARIADRDRLKAEVSVQRLVGLSGVALKKSGKDMLGRCPFDDDAKASTDPGGNTKTYTLDAAGRVTLEEHCLQGSELDQRIRYQYDSDGNLASYAQQDGTGQPISSATYTKDAQGRTTQSALTYGTVHAGAAATGPGTLAFTIGQGFNADGQLSSHTYPDGSQQSYTYDTGRLAQITLPNQSQIRYGNYQWNAPGQITTPGATKTLAYDALQRHTRIEVHNSTGQLRKRS